MMAALICLMDWVGIHHGTAESRITSHHVGEDITYPHDDLQQYSNGHIRIEMQYHWI